MINISELKNKFKIYSLKIFDYKYFVLLYILCLFAIVLLEYFEGNYFESEWIFCLGIGVVGVFLTVYSVLSVERLHRITFVIIVLFGLLAVFVYPVLSLPDEVEHFNRAELTSRGDLFVQSYEHGYKTIKSTNNLMEHCYEIAFDNTVLNEKIDYSLAYCDSVFAQNLFYCYVPQAFGILLAKLLDLNVIWMMWLGRLCNLLVYACICTYAVKKAPFFKLQLLLVACLPLSIQQAASMSSDAMFIYLSLLSLAYFFYLYVKPENTINFREIFIFFVLCLLVALIKPPCIMFVFLALFIPKSNFKSKKEYICIWIGLVLLCLIVLAWNFLYAIPKLNNSFRQDTFTQFGIDAKNQLKFILDNPIKSIITFISPTFLWIVFSRVFYFGDFMSVYNAFFLSNSLIILFGLYYIALLLYPKGDFKLANKTRIGIFIVNTIIYFGFLFVQYLTWSPVGANFIHGLQGRYILPILALFPLSFTLNTNFSFLNDNKNKLDLLFIVLMIVFLSAVFILLVYFYYMSGQYAGRAIFNTSNIY